MWYVIHQIAYDPYTDFIYRTWSEIGTCEH